MKQWFINVLGLLLCLPIWAQDVQFINPSDNNADLIGTILDIIQDADGFIWIATTDGLIRYDGRRTTIFRNLPHDSTSLSHNYARDLLLASDGRVWIGTKSGVSVYNPDTECFKQFIIEDSNDFAADNQVLTMEEDWNGRIWYSTYNGVYQFNPGNFEGRAFYSREAENDNSIPNESVWSIYADSQERIWFGSSTGITVFEPSSSEPFKRLNLDEISGGPTNAGFFGAFTEEQSGSILIGSDNGLFRMSTAGNSYQFTRLSDGILRNEELNQSFINDILIDASNRIWVATEERGIFEINVDDTASKFEIFNYQHDPLKTNSLRYNKVFNLMQDRGGMMWIATQTGLNQILPGGKKFTVVSSDPDNPNSLTGSIIKAITSDHYGNLWVGTTVGLNLLTREQLASNEFDFQHLVHDATNPQTLSHNNIFDLLVDRKNHLWVCTRSGLNVADLNEGSNDLVFRRIGESEGLQDEHVYGIQQFGENDYWISTFGGFSSMNYDPDGFLAPSFIHYPMAQGNQEGIVNSMSFMTEEESPSRFWVATFAGLSSLDIDQGSAAFNNFLFDPKDTASISDNSIIDVIRDEDGHIWIGTRNGLNLVNYGPQTGIISFSSFGEQHGLLNPVIQSIESDDNGYLWLGSNKGITKFDRKAALEGQIPSVTNFTAEDGVAGPGQVFRASHKSADGTMFFGSSGGINIFHPNQFGNNSFQPEVILSGIKIFNKSITPSTPDQTVLKKSVSRAESVTINHKQDMVSFEFSMADYSNPKKNLYRYKLIGFNEGWIENGTDNTAVFTNLDPGRYTLQIEGSNSDGIWSGKIKELAIIVTPPWWKTIWAYLLYAIALAGAVTLFIRRRIQKKIKIIEDQARLENARREEREKIRRKNAVDFHDDLGHRLTKISLLINLAQSGGSEQGTSVLSKIREQTTALSDGIKDLIWSMDPKKDSLKETFMRLQEFGDQLYEFTDIAFKTFNHASFEDFDLNPEARKNILLIFKEAMNNSIKYSAASTAVLELMDDDEYYQIQFMDDGIGFSMNGIIPGYGIKSMKERASKIGYQLQIRSTEGKGTVIDLILPK